MCYLGFYILGAVQRLLSPVSVAPVTAADRAATLSADVFRIVIALACLGLLGVSRIVTPASLGFSRADLRVERQALLTVAVYGVLGYMIGWLPQLIVDWIGLHDPNGGLFADTPVPDALLGSVAAGVSEEILALAVPLVLLERAGLARWRRGGRPAGLVITVLLLTAARMGYHVYRGWDSLGFLPWALASVLVFYFTRGLIALIVAHSCFDLVALLLPRAGLYSSSQLA